MLMKRELAIEIKAQIPPIGLRLEGSGASIRGKPQIQRWIVVIVFATEVKELRLVVFEL